MPVSFLLLCHTPEETSFKDGRFLPATETEVCSGSPGSVVWPVLSYDAKEEGQGVSFRAFPQLGPLSILSQHSSASWGPSLQCMSPGLVLKLRALCMLVKRSATEFCCPTCFFDTFLAHYVLYSN